MVEHSEIFWFAWHSDLMVEHSEVFVVQRPDGGALGDLLRGTAT